MRKAAMTVAAVAALSALTPVTGADEPSFVFTSIDVPDAIATSAFGINARGEIVGFYRDASNRQHGYVLGRHGLRSIDYPGAALTDARGIGPDGEVVGAYRNPGEPAVNFHGYRLTPHGDYLALDYPGHTSTIAQRIAPDGTVHGCYHDEDQMGTMYGVTIRGDERTALDMPMTMSNVMARINSRLPVCAAKRKSGRTR